MKKKDQYRFELDPDTEDALLFRLLRGNDRTIKEVVVMGIRAKFSEAERNGTLVGLVGVEIANKLKKGISLKEIVNEYFEGAFKKGGNDVAKNNKPTEKKGGKERPTLPVPPS